MVCVKTRINFLTPFGAVKQTSEDDREIHVPLLSPAFQNSEQKRSALSFHTKTAVVTDQLLFQWWWINLISKGLVEEKRRGWGCLNINSDIWMCIYFAVNDDQWCTSDTSYGSCWAANKRIKIKKTHMRDETWRYETAREKEKRR